MDVGVHVLMDVQAVAQAHVQVDVKAAAISHVVAHVQEDVVVIVTKLIDEHPLTK